MTEHPATPTSSADSTTSTPFKRGNDRDDFGPNEHTSKPQRKRMRVPTSCSVCRKRKIKCDKQKPTCGSCLRSSVSHLCHYEEPSWVHSQDLLKFARPSPSFDATNNTRTAGAKSNGTTSDEHIPVAVQQKIENLQDKIKHLEASIAVTELSRVTTSLYPNNNNARPTYLPPQTNGTAPLLPYHQPGPQLPAPVSNVFSMAGESSNANNNSNIRNFGPLPPLLNTSEKGPNYDFIPHERVNIFDDHLPFLVRKNRLENHGPISIPCVIRRDIYMKVLWMSVVNLVVKSHENVCHPTEATVIADLSKDTSKVKTKCTMASMKATKTKYKKRTLEILALSDGNKTAINNKILEILPTQKIVMLLVLRFFKSVYPFFPFIHENTFFSEIDGILGTIGFKDQKVNSLNIKSKYDYATVALLLLVLRLAYLSFDPQELYQISDFKPLLESPISSDAVAVARTCLREYDIYRKSYSSKMIQIMIYLKIYWKYCPEDDDVTDHTNGQISLSFIFGSAYGLGLHRDPKSLEALADTDGRGYEKIQLWRKLWYKLLELDSSQAVTSGLPLLVNTEDNYDTLLPELDQYLNKIDRFVILDFRLINMKVKLFREIMKSISNIKNPPTLLDLFQGMKKIETFLKISVGDPKEILLNNEFTKYEKLKRISYHLEASTLLIIISSLITAHFEKINDSRRYYEALVEQLKMLVNIVNTTINIAYNFQSYFGLSFIFYIKPFIATAVFRTFVMLLSVLVRAMQTRNFYEPDENSERYALFNQLVENIFKILDHIMQLLAKLSYRNYNFSRLVLANRIILHEVKDPQFDINACVDAFELQPQPQTCLGDTVPNFNISSFNFKKEDFPRSNHLTNLLNSEIQYLIDLLKPKLSTILQPVIKESDPDANVPTDVSNAKNQAFPIPSTASDIPEQKPHTDEQIDQQNIFNESLFYEYPELQQSSTNSNDNPFKINASLLSSEDYVGVFRLFEDFDIDLETHLPD